MRRLYLVPLGLVAALSFAAVAHGDDFITAVTNNAAFGNGPIQTWSLDLTTGTATQVGSFVPQGAVPGGPNGPDPNGRGIAVTNTEFYYTELSGTGFGATLSIETAPFNGGAGGPDNGSIANPIPGDGIADIHFGSSISGDLFALTGYPNQPGGPTVVAFNATTGLIDPSVPEVQIPVDSGADGFTILPDGNYLVNSGDADNVYNQYSALTGALIPGTTISAPGCGTATGVDTNGTDLFFNCNFDSIVETTLTGTLVNTFALPGNHGSAEGISLIENFSPPPPGATPEPSSLLLMGIGLAGMIGMYRKMRGSEGVA